MMPTQPIRRWEPLADAAQLAHAALGVLAVTILGVAAAVDLVGAVVAVYFELPPWEQLLAWIGLPTAIWFAGLALPPVFRFFREPEGCPMAPAEPPADSHDWDTGLAEVLRKAGPIRARMPLTDEERREIADEVRYDRALDARD